jgi:hypothetical protein
VPAADPVTVASASPPTSETPPAPEPEPTPATATAPVTVTRPLEPPQPLRSVVLRDSLSPDSPELAFRVPGTASQPLPEATTTAPEPAATREQTIQEILAESAQKRLEQANLKREVALSKAREAWELHRRAQAERLAFHEDLRRLLQGLGNRAGPEIKSLCDRYGRAMHSEVQKAMTVALNRLAASVKLEVKLGLMRAYGAPEAMLLDSLANELDRTRNQRGGPRDHNEVRVRAALLLLKYPPPPEKPVATSRSSATTVAHSRGLR